MIAYTSAVFLGAFLLFQVQPLIARYILPWYGGSPAVWSTCLLFFQVVLVLGYAYAHFVTERLERKQQVFVHGAVLLIALVVLPITPNATWKPAGGGDPLFGITTLLAVSVGIPYLALAASAPLLQRWFVAIHPERSPYRLYALSNLGSLLGLWLYPFLLEPFFSLEMQTKIWSAFFALYVVVSGGCAWALTRAQDDAAEPSTEPDRDPHPRYLWVLLPFAGSLLLLAGTNQICRDVAVVPLLWILPLSVYLLSFIVAFGNPRWYHRSFWIVAVVASFAGALYLLPFDFGGEGPHLVTQVALYVAAIFAGCMVCHGELVRTRPPARELTSFYVLVAIGGALGGVFVNFAARYWFKGYWEFHLALVLTWILLGWCVYRARQPVRSLSALWAGALVGLVIFLNAHIREELADAVDTRRSFYGVLRVYDVDVGGRDHLRGFYHGRIAHGEQFMNASRRREPTGYYGLNSGLGEAIKTQRRVSRDRLRIGVIGLGTGTIVAHARKGEEVRYYEIDPDVVAVANEHFFYLADAHSEMTIVLGDARISLERELALDGSQGFDVLVVDAFSGGGIPTHLLTREAFDLYWGHLREGGVIVVNSSNVFMELGGIVRRQAEALGAQAVLVQHERNFRPGETRNKWVLVTKNATFLRAIARHVDPWLEEPLKSSLWTDDYSNLLEVIWTD